MAVHQNFIIHGFESRSNLKFYTFSLATAEVGYIYNCKDFSRVRAIFFCSSACYLQYRAIKGIADNHRNLFLLLSSSASLGEVKGVSRKSVEREIKYKAYR